MSWTTKSVILLAAAVIGPVPLLVLLGFADPRALWSLFALAPLGLLLVRRLVSPLDELSDTAGRLGHGDLAARPDIRLEGPWQRVADTLGELAEQLDTVSTDLEQQVQERTAELDRKASQLRALGQIGRQVAAVLEPGELLHFVVRLVRGTFGYDLVAVVQEREAHLLVSACAAKGITEPPVGRVYRAGDPAVAALTQLLADDGREDTERSKAGSGLDDERGGCSGRTNNAREDGESEGGSESEIGIRPADTIRPNETTASEHAVSHTTTQIAAEIAAQTELVVPIRLAERTLGVMVVQSLKPDAFDEDDVFTVKTIAGQVAVALENARLFDAERRLRSLAITEERNRMAREIHDTLAQGFMGILMHLRAMRGIADQRTADEHRQAAEALAQESLDEARRSVWNLRPARLHDKNLASALQDELERLRGQAAVVATLHVTGDVRAADDLAPDYAAALLRIGQEALHNVAKHAHASQVQVTLHVTNETAELRVEDDGVGFAVDRGPDSIAEAGSSGSAASPDSIAETGASDRTGSSHAPDPAPAPPAPARRTTFGLLGMKERAHSLSGTIAIESAPGAGTTVRVRLPLRKETAL